MSVHTHCDMDHDCGAPITHIGEKGYTYCAAHVGCRRGIERCRRLRKWELDMLARGVPIPSYKPSRKPTVQS